MVAARLCHAPISSRVLVNPPASTMPGLITFPHVCTKEHREFLLPFAVKVAEAAVVWEAGRFLAAGMRARTQISSAVTGHYCQTKGLCAAPLGPTAPRPSVSWGRHLSIQNPLSQPTENLWSTDCPSQHSIAGAPSPRRDCGAEASTGGIITSKRT